MVEKIVKKHSGIRNKRKKKIIILKIGWLYDQK